MIRKHKKEKEGIEKEIRKKKEGNEKEIRKKRKEMKRK